MYRLLLLIAVFLLFHKTGTTQVAGKQVPVKIPSTASAPNALLYLPWDYNVSGEKYPIILFGHGISETTVGSLANQGLPGDISRGKYPYTVVKGDTVHFIVLSITGQAFLTDQQMSDGVKDLIKRGIRIDENRIYLTGLSAGARATVRYISRMESQNFQPVAATVPMSYTLSVDEVKKGYWAINFEAYKGKGLWAFSGKTDTHVEVAKFLASSVNKYSPGNGRVTIYPGGHCCWMTYYDPEYKEVINGRKMSIYDWMYQYSVNGKVSTLPPTPNKAPVADAGKDQTITLPTNSVTLDGSSSSDEDGSVVSYKWEKTSGPDNFKIDDAGKATTKVSDLTEGIYVFTLTVKDDKGASSTAKVTVTVNATPNKAPVADAGKDQTITLPTNSVTLDGSSSSDEDGSVVSYKWEKTSGPDDFKIDDAGKATTKVSDLTEGTYVFTLTVEDDKGSSSSDQISVTVNNATTQNTPPVADAGNNVSVTLPKNSITLDGSASKDEDGKIVSYKWEKTSGPDNFKIDDASKANTKVSDLTEGTYVFTLTVKDDKGASSSSSSTIDVKTSDAKPNGGQNRLVADAGPDIVTTMPVNKIILDGRRSREKNPGVFFKNFKWEKISGPDKCNIVFPTKEITRVKDLEVGTYVFRFTFTINTNETASDIVQVTVKPDPVEPGDVSYNANTKVPDYKALFQYGTNTGSYGNGWTDEKVADAATKAGVHSIRLPLPDFFVTHYGYDIRLEAFKHYTSDLGMKEITLFVGRPAPEHRDPKIYPPATQQSKVFDHLYEPIWDHGENGTPVNDKNTFAVYIYNLIERYGKQIKFWEIVNEADATGFWDNGRKERSDSWYNVAPSSKALINLNAPVYSYIRMLRVAYEVIKKYDPQDYVATGGIGYPAFLDALLRYTDNPDGGKVTAEYPLKGGAYFDVVSYHSYPAYNFQVWDGSIGGFRYLRYSDRAANAVINLKGEFEDILKQYGYDGIKYPNKLFIVTETNLTRKTFDTYYGTNDIQRNFIIKVLTKAQQNGIKQLYVYGIGESENYNTATGAYGLMGLYENMKRDKPGQEKLTDEGKAYKTTSMLLYGWRYDDARTKQMNLPEAVDGMAFKKGSEYRYVLWAKTHTDKSEVAHATYSFPASFDLATVDRYEWNYSVDSKAKSRIRAQNISLTGVPAFFSEAEKASDNQAPVADAGKDQVLTLPSNSITLNGSASSDADGTLVQYRWEKIAGPSSFAMDKTDQVQTKVSGLVQGRYTFRLTVTDDKKAQSTDEVTVTVNAAPNQAPIADAGNNVSVTMPKNSVTLDGSASKDEDGKIVSYQWEQKSGPSTATIFDAESVSTKVSDLKEGTYVFVLTTTDDKKAKATDEITVTVSAASNKSPVADAGNNVSITLQQNFITLDGSASKDEDGKIVSYKWEQKSGPSTATIAEDENITTKVSRLEKGTYIFTLTVEDDKGSSSSDQVSVTVNSATIRNTPPVADAGNNVSITLPKNSVTLDGSASKDEDGKVVSYKWEQKSGPSTATIVEDENVTTKVFGLKKGTYVFTLTIEDDKGSSSSDQVSVTVNSATIRNTPPVADAGNNVSITLPKNSVTLDGSASKDEDGKIVSYKWEQKSGPSTATIAEDKNVTTKVTGLEKGTYVFILTTTDDKKSQSTDEVTVTVDAAPNQAPIADAGNNVSVTLLKNSVTLDGSASKDEDGKIVSFKWEQKSGPSTATIAEDENITTKVSGLEKGTYIFTLTIEDDKGSSSSDQVSVTVNSATIRNTPPVADAGNNISVTLPKNSVTLDGSASKDEDGKIVSYKWEQKSGPSTATIAEDENITTKVSGLEKGTYIFTLTIEDDKGSSSSDQVSVTVNSATIRNTPPVADAGNNISVTLPKNSVTLDGSASKDEDGKIVSYKWEQKSGPSAATIAEDKNVTTKVSGLEKGTYVFALEVEDDKKASAIDSVRINVKEIPHGPSSHVGNSRPPVNKAPVADAGKNQVITLPLDSVKLNGSAKDEDGKVVSYKWEQKSGPSTATIVEEGNITTKVTDLQKGTYVFALEVMDDKNASAVDSVKIVVKKATAVPGNETGNSKDINEPPIANAGPDQTLVLPKDFIVLDGSSSQDKDGKIVSYKWEQISGPVNINMEGSNDARLHLSDLKKGRYVFKLTVIDNKGDSASDEVNIDVKAAPNKPPYASAGKDIDLVLPQNTAILDGSNSFDEDGKIVSYKWEQISGPVTVILGDHESEKCKVSQLVMGTYDFKLTVTDNRGAVSTATVSVYVEPEKDENKKLTFSVYPNPVHDQLHVEFNKVTDGFIKFRVIGVNGRVLKVFDFGRQTQHIHKILNVSDLTEGIYFIQLIEDNQLRNVYKIVKY